MTGDKISEQENLSMTDQEPSDHPIQIIQNSSKTIQSNSSLNLNELKREILHMVSPNPEQFDKWRLILENAEGESQVKGANNIKREPYEHRKLFVETYQFDIPCILKLIRHTTIEAEREYRDCLIDHPSTRFPKYIFYPYQKKNGFLFKYAEPVCHLQPNTNYSLPVVVDTEYVSPEFENLENDAEDSFIEPRRHVTTQFKAFYSNRPRILVHNELIEGYLNKRVSSENYYRVVRHPVIRPYQSAHIIPYLRLEGYDASLLRNVNAHERKNKNTFCYPFVDLKLYAHMAVVDLTQIFEGDFLDDIENAFVRGKITMNRRLTTAGWQPFASMPWILQIGSLKFRVNLSIVDTLGLHGNATYKEICENTGVALTVKDEMDEWKSAMDQAYFKVPEKFDSYAMEDLKGDHVLINNAAMIRKIYGDLGVLDWYIPPKLTIGATVNDLFVSKLNQFIGLTPDMPKKQREEIRKKLTYTASADHLKTLVQSNAYLLGKCDGGRCRNAYPMRSSFKGVLVDIDVSGAYTTSMSSLLFPLGNPVLVSFKKVLLKDFLTIHAKNLVGGLWKARIQTREKLSYEQSLIPSWFHLRKTINRKRLNKNDSESFHVTGQVDLDSGNSKIFAQEIIQGTLTSDLLDIIENVWSPRQREDFFNKTEILAVGFYPKSLKVEQVSEVLHALKEGKKDFKTTLKGATVINEEDCHVWTTFPMGEQFIDLFTTYRRLYPKGSPLNILCKLYPNTTYGDAVSKYFETSNMIFGSNITARCRAMMYLMEIGLNLQGSITDGHVFDVNRVLHKKEGKYLNSDHFIRLYTKKNRELKEGDIGHIRPLFTKPVIKKNGGFLINDEFCTYAQAQEKVNRQAEQHLRKLFPKVEMIGKMFRKLKDKVTQLEYVEEQSLFRLEMKDFVSEASVQGAANYQFVFFEDDPDPKKMNEKIKTKMRSYESKKKCRAIFYQDDDSFPIIKEDFYTRSETPDVHLLREIRQNPDGVAYLPPFIKSFIIKPGDFKNRYRSLWKDSLLIAGDSALKACMIRYLSLSQFTFLTLEQYLQWEKVETKMIKKFGYSLEYFYMNPDGTLHYQKMIEDCDTMIRKGVMNPLKVLDKNRHFNRLEKDVVLKGYQALLNVKKRLALKLKSDVWEEIEELNYFEDND